MTKVCDLPHGWSLVRDAATGRAFFERRGHRISAYEFAGQPEARTVFRGIKRRLDAMDASGYKADDRDWYAIDWAKIALQTSLQAQRRWSPELLETGA